MHETNKTSGKKILTRRGFFKAIVPGLFAAGVVKAAGMESQPAAGSYGNGPYGGVVAEPVPVSLRKP